MSELRQVTDITISDRLTTQLKNELTIKELQEKINRLEADVTKFKTQVSVVTDPKTGVTEIGVSLNGKTKVVELDTLTIDHYLTSSSSLDDLLADALEILVRPYYDVLKGELAQPLAAVLSNRADVKAGRKL